MKIAVIGQLHDPIAQPFASGMEMFTYSLVRSLMQRGHDVTLFASGDSADELPVVPLVKRATRLESQQRFGGPFLPWMEDTEDEVYAELMAELLTADFDVVHNNTCNPVPLRYGSLLGPRLLTTLHAARQPRLEAELRERGWEACGQFVNVSHSGADAWRKLVPQQTVISNGIDTQWWRTAAEKSPRAVYFGRILPDKGTHLAIEAAHRAGLSIDVAGPICDANYFQTAIQPRLNQDDKYHGEQPPERLRTLIGRAAVALMMPCPDEPVGIDVAEALACGTPVAGFARGELPELVTPEVGRLARAPDVQALAMATRGCMDLDSRRCRAYAKQHYSLQSMVDAYESLYVAQQPHAAA